jgi:hypothetical protein
MDHTITIATKQAPIDTLEPPTMGTLYRWECSCGKAGMSWKSTEEASRFAAVAHLEAAVDAANHGRTDADFVGRMPNRRSEGR